MTPRASSDIPSAYNAADVERRIYQEWLDKEYFTAKIEEELQKGS